MATLMYPVKMLHDESNQPFIPFTAIDVIYNKYTSTSQLPTPAREGNVATVQDGNDYNLYIYYNGAWSPLTQEGPAGESGVYVGPTAPTDGSTVWIDNSGTTAVLKLYDGSAWESVPAITGADGRDGVIQYTAGNGIAINTTTNTISANVDTAPTSGSNKLLTSGAIYTALGNKQDPIVFNTAYDATSNKAATMADIQAPPTVGNGTLTIQKNGTAVDTFTANATADKAINITVPTNTNELTNGAGFITSAGVPTSITWNTAYNASSNKAATMSDVPAILSGTTEPTSGQGRNGDLYILTD